MKQQHYLSTLAQEGLGMLGNREKLINLGWLVLWGTFSTVWCWTAGHALGPTFDEPWYVRAGLKNWRDLNHRELLTQGTMPLPAEVQMLPLRVAEVFTSADPERDWRAWLPTARMGTVVFVWILLWGSFRLGALYGGVWGGRLAVALVACEPILLGHASLATADVAFSGCLVALLAVFRGRREEPSWRGRLVLPAVWVVAAFMAKASAILFVPVCLAMVELERFWSAGWRPWPSAPTRVPGEEGRKVWQQALASLRDLVVLGLMGAALLFAVCPRCSRGLLFQLRYQTTYSNGEIYLLGQYSESGFRHYFAAALAIKLALSVFALMLVILVLRPRYLLNGAILAGLALLAFTPTFRVQTGVRYVLPIAALALVGAAAAFGRWWSEQPAGPRRALASAFATICVVWSLASACVVWPNGMCYTNELFGGTRNGHLALTESNIDWGQGLNELADWGHDHADAPLHLWYFGTDPACMDAPFRPICPHTLERGDELRKICGGGYLAASTTMVYGYLHDTPAARYLRTLEPCAQTSTHLIYDFRRAAIDGRD
jgi:hypothetical protein